MYIIYMYIVHCTIQCTHVQVYVLCTSNVNNNKCIPGYWQYL